MIAQNIAHQAILAGYSVLITAADLLLDLGAQESSRALERRLGYYAKIGLLILGEIGFLAFDSRKRRPALPGRQRPLRERRRRGTAARDPGTIVLSPAMKMARLQLRVASPRDHTR